MSWKAVTSMPADEVEALELDARHEVDLRLVLGLPAAEVQALLDRARRDLERALGAEIVISKSHACPDRSALMSYWTDTTTSARRDRVLGHAATCSVCGPNLPRSVSPARVFALLPAPVLSSAARLEVLGFFEDPGMAVYREFTVSRAAGVTWFLSPPEPSRPAPGPAPGPARSRSVPAAARPPGRRRPRVSRIGVAAAACVTLTAAFALVGFHVIPSAATASSPPAAATGEPGSATAQPGAVGGRRPARQGQAVIRRTVLDQARPAVRDDRDPLAGRGRRLAADDRDPLAGRGRLAARDLVPGPAQPARRPAETGLLADVGLHAQGERKPGRDARPAGPGSRARRPVHPSRPRRAGHAQQPAGPASGRSARRAGGQRDPGKRRRVRPIGSSAVIGAATVAVSAPSPPSLPGR
jgi:hypothetical protein